MGQTPHLSVRDLCRMHTEPTYEGYGYLGHMARRADAYYGMSEPHRQALLRDEAVVAEANRRGWMYDQLFDFANSREGRYMGDHLEDTETVTLLAKVVARHMVAWTLWAQANGTPDTLTAPPPDLLPSDQGVLIDARTRRGGR